jgi:two-component system, response regulator
MRTIAEILVVDDSNDDAALTLNSLRSIIPTATVLRLIDGEQALHYICSTGGYSRRPPGLPRLVLLDLHLPGMDGIAVLQALRARPGFQELPVVLWTSCSNPLLVEQAVQAGASAYHVKPTSLDGYRAEIGTIVQRWLPSPATSDASTSGASTAA